MLRRAVLVAVVGVAGSVAWRYARPAAVIVQAESNTPSQQRMIVGAGRVEPASEEIRIGSAIDGRLDSVPVEEGQAVQRGQILATLDGADLRARIDLAAAGVAEREAMLERLINGSRNEQRQETKAQVREAEVVLEAAGVERSRRGSLLERGAISRFEYDVVDRDYAVAKARIDAVRQRAALIQDETRPEDVKRVRAEIDRAKAELAEASAQFEKSIIRSPIRGIVLRKKLRSGESVFAKAGDTIVTLGDCSRLRVRVDVDENDVGRLKPGLAAWIRAEAYGDRKFRGRVTKVGSILGRKNVRTDEPVERIDMKILETLVDLEPGVSIPIGLRVDAFIEPRS